MCDKMATSANILKIVKNDPFLRLQMSAKEMFNRHQLFPTPPICLILHQFNLYVLLVRGKKIGDD